MFVLEITYVLLKFQSDYKNKAFSKPNLESIKNNHTRVLRSKILK